MFMNRRLNIVIMLVFLILVYRFKEIPFKITVALITREPKAPNAKGESLQKLVL